MAMEWNRGQSFIWYAYCNQRISLWNEHIWYKWYSTYVSTMALKQGWWHLTFRSWWRQWTVTFGNIFGMHMFWEFSVDSIGCILTVDRLGHVDPTLRVKYDLTSWLATQWHSMEWSTILSFSRVDISRWSGNWWLRLIQGLLVILVSYSLFALLLLVCQCSVRKLGGFPCQNVLQLPGMVYMVIQT